MINVELNDVSPDAQEYNGVYENGTIQLTGKVNWPDGTPVVIRVADACQVPSERDFGKVIIAGFGLPGRWIADIFDRYGIDYVIIEQNQHTIAAQRRLGRTVIEGDIRDEQTLRDAGIEDASLLALTVPDEGAVLEATRLARQIKPDIYIAARTNFISAGLKAAELGADDVVKAEQAVAREFYETMLRRLASHGVRLPALDPVG